MSKMDAAVRPDRTVVLSGESLDVKTTIRNPGQEPLLVPSRNDPSPFVYRLDPQQPDRPQYVLSERAMVTSLSPGSVRPDEMQNPLTLPPGGWTLRQEEIANYSSEPLRAGKYLLSVVQNLPEGSVASASTPVEIALPELLSYTSQTCLGERTRPAVFAHAEGPGVVAVLQRESLIGRPRHSVFYRRATVDKVPAGFRFSVSVAVKVVAMQGQGRWFAWLGPSGLTSQYGFGSAAPVTAGPVATGLEASYLLPTGFEIADRVVLFFVLGQKAGGTVLQAYRLSNNRIERAWEAPFGPHIPSQVSVRYEPSGTSGRLFLVWLENEQGKTLVSSLSYSAEGGRLSPRRIELDGPLAALSLAPTVPARPGEAAGPPLHVLSGPDLRNEMTCRRIWLDSRPEANPLRFPAPARKAEAWAITAGDGDPLVLAKSGPQLWLARTSRLAWQVVADRVSETKNLQVYTLDGANYFAEWLDRDGFRLAAVIGR